MTPHMCLVTPLRAMSHSLRFTDCCWWGTDSHRGVWLFLTHTLSLAAVSCVDSDVPELPVCCHMPAAFLTFPSGCSGIGMQCGGGNTQKTIRQQPLLARLQLRLQAWQQNPFMETVWWLMKPAACYVDVWSVWHSVSLWEERHRFTALQGEDEKSADRKLTLNLWACKVWK